MEFGREKCAMLVMNQALPYILMNKINELNEQIYAGGKLFCEKNGIPSKSTWKNFKTGMGISTGKSNTETFLKNNRPKW